MFTAILANGRGLALVARRIPLTIDRPNLFLANEIFCLFLQQIVASDDEGEDDAEAAFLASLTEKQKKKLLRFDFICGILLFRFFFLRSLMGGACTILNISTEKNKKKNKTEQNRTERKPRDFANVYRASYSRMEFVLLLTLVKCNLR